MKSYLSIKEPCHEGWEKMSLSEKGRFCSSCQKEVHDFSNSTVEQIKKAYSESQDGLCGHIPVKILQEEHFEKHLQRGHFSHLKKIWIAAVFCFGASLFTVDAAKASTFYKIRTFLFNFVENNKDTIVVKGLVQDRDRKTRMPFVTIQVFHNDSIIANALTDVEGAYEVKIPKEYSNVKIKALYIGYTSKLITNISIAPDKLVIVDFELQEEEYLLDGIMMMDEPVKKTKSKKGK